MNQIKLCPELNEIIADLLLDCTDGMLLYAGTYIKELERLEELDKQELKGGDEDGI